MTHERLEFIKALALEAGHLTLLGYGKCRQVPKDGPDGYDIATEFDLRTEELVRSRILAEYGEPFLGEEDGLIGKPADARQSLWIVDPIDGTFNYQRGLPLYGVSIAYCEGGLPTCGAIYLPALDQLYYAAEGSGAYLIERGIDEAIPLRVSQERETDRLVLSFDGVDTYALMAACAGAGVPWRSLRLLLCAAASIAYVASGQVDAFADRISLWDCAAGDLIVREAGGPPLRDYQGEPIFPNYVHRLLDPGETAKFSCVAISSEALWEQTFRGLLDRAGLRRQPERGFMSGNPGTERSDGRTFPRFDHP